MALTGAGFTQGELSPLALADSETVCFVCAHHAQELDRFLKGPEWKLYSPRVKSAVRVHQGELSVYSSGMKWPLGIG
jgi:hypothetical protein